MNQYIIETDNLNFSYSKSNKEINNLNLQVAKGSIYGFLGPNGSGKTTTIRLLLGLLKKDSGKINLFGESFDVDRLKSLQNIGALIETPSLYGHLNAKENLIIASNYRGRIDKGRIDEVLETVKLTYAKNKKVKAFSLGMKQRLGIAIALLSEPNLLILDEPTNGLDPKGILEMRSLIKELNEKGITIFISSHLLSEIEKTCSHVGIIRDGEVLFEGTVKSLKESHKGKIILEIELDDVDLIENLIDHESIDSNFIRVSLNNKQEIPKLLDMLRERGVEIYQIIIKNNLEDLFLSLTEN